MKKIIWILILNLVLPGWCLAQDNGSDDPSTSNASNSQKLTPIDAQTYGWQGRYYFHGYTVYSHDGVQLHSVGDFKQVIQPLGDEQANALLRSADDKTAVGGAFLVGGTLVCVGSLANLLVQVNQTVSSATAPDPNVGLFTLLFLSGTAGWVGGMLVQSDGMMDAYSAADRYNAALKADSGLSLGPAIQGGPIGLSLTQRF